MSDTGQEKLTERRTKIDAQGSDHRTTLDRQGKSQPANPYGWWFADCPHHGRTPHLSVLGGVCERCAAERQARSYQRTRQ